MRIDKLLANKAFGSRKEVHQLIKTGLVSINGQVIKKKDFSINPDIDKIEVNGKVVSTQLSYYIKLYKPAGYITAVQDSQPVVMDLLPPEFLKLDVFPVGRLDKDTEGLLLLTNDGSWGHRIINGHKHVPKKYYFEYEGCINKEGIQKIQEGLVLADGTQCKPAHLELQEDYKGQIVIEEGKYHQVKRMISAVGGKITYLKRLTIGALDLSDLSSPGDYRELTIEEVKLFD